MALGATLKEAYSRAFDCDRTSAFGGIVALNQEVDEATANLLALLEPIMIVVLGMIIGGIVISMYLPMFDLISKIG